MKAIGKFDKYYHPMISAAKLAATAHNQTVSDLLLNEPPTLHSEQQC